MSGCTLLTSRHGLCSPIGLLVMLALSLVAAGCGSSSVAAVAAAGGGAPTTAQQPSAVVSGQTTGETAPSAVGSKLFDSSVVHEIAVLFAQEDYEAMIEAYSGSGDKEWIEATVTIDGRTYRNVGMRLKGNSSIMGLRRNGDSQTDGGGARGGGVSGNVSADDPQGLPWLIDLDKNVDGQNHGGFVELAVRSNTTQTALNEAVALELLQQAGLASQEAIAVRFSINGSEPELRLVVENPDDGWMAENFDVGGALYKAESSGDYSYRGDDPEAYDEVFDQEAGKYNADLTPLIDFLDFVNNSDDETFNAELVNHLDVHAFATYLAMQELIANADDIDGPGNNSYLYYDTKSKVFTVVAWDHNLAFGSMGGMGFGGGGDMQVPDDMTVPGAGQVPGADQNVVPRQQAGDAGARVVPPVMPQEGVNRGGPAGGGGSFGKSNILVERFKANSEFEQLYGDRLAELRDQLYGSGAAEEILETWTTLLKTQAPDLVDEATVTEEAARISRYFTM